MGPGRTPTVRAARLDDCAAINRILNDAILTTTSTWNWDAVPLPGRERWLRDKRAGGWPVLVADRDGRVAGFATYGSFHGVAGYLHTVEHSIYLDAAARGQGLGTLLMDALEADAAARGVHVMAGLLDAENTGSLAFHTARGYRAVAYLPEVGRKFGGWRDLVIVQKLLPGQADTTRDGTEADRPGN